MYFSKVFLNDYSLNLVEAALSLVLVNVVYNITRLEMLLALKRFPPLVSWIADPKMLSFSKGA